MVEPRAGVEWNQKEMRIAVQAYLELLEADLNGIAIVKRKFVEQLRTRLPARSRGSIEYRFGNISSVLQEMGLRWAKGYVPHSHIRAELESVVDEELAARPDLH